MGPKEVKSPVLSLEEEAVIVAFRKHTLPPLDDCLYALKESIPHLARSSLHRCLQRHGISRLPDMGREAGTKKEKKKFKSYPIGFLHIDITEVRTEAGKLYLFVAIDCSSKYVVVNLYDRAITENSKAFLEYLIAHVPYKIYTVLTDNGFHFADLPKNTNGATVLLGGHPFDRVCKKYGKEHRLTKPNQPWTNGQVERMNRTIKEATGNCYYYQTNSLKSI